MTAQSLKSTISSESTLWLAYCSNSIRSTDECVQKTQETLQKAIDEEREQLADWLGKQVVTAYLNRGNDIAFVAALFALDNAKLALGCVETVLDIHTRASGSGINVKTYMDDYSARFDEQPEYLVLKLRWLTLYTNYSDNVDEAERIMALLTDTKTSEVA